jgi:hypothetical protein
LPSKDEHIKKAARNEGFAQVLAKGTYYDWAAVALFYAALHYVDSVLAVSGEHPRSHERRHELIPNNPTLKRVYSEYRALETLSHNARYYAMPIEPQHVHDAQNDYDTIKAFIRKCFNLA